MHFHGPDGLGWDVHIRPDTDTEADRRVSVLALVPPGRTRTWTLETMEQHLLGLLDMLDGATAPAGFQWMFAEANTLPDYMRAELSQIFREAMAKGQRSTVLIHGWLQLELP